MVELGVLGSDINDLALCIADAFLHDHVLAADVLENDLFAWLAIDHGVFEAFAPDDLLAGARLEHGEVAQVVAFLELVRGAAVIC